MRRHNLPDETCILLTMVVGIFCLISGFWIGRAYAEAKQDQVEHTMETSACSETTDDNLHVGVPCNPNADAVMFLGTRPSNLREVTVTPENKRHRYHVTYQAMLSSGHSVTGTVDVSTADPATTSKWFKDMMVHVAKLNKITMKDVVITNITPLTDETKL